MWFCVEPPYVQRGFTSVHKGVHLVFGILRLNTWAHWGQPLLLLRLYSAAVQGWPHLEHIHKICLPDPCDTWDGKKILFGSHSAKMYSFPLLRHQDSKSLIPLRTCFPEHTGHPRPFALLCMVAVYVDPHFVQIHLAGYELILETSQGFLSFAFVSHSAKRYSFWFVLHQVSKSIFFTFRNLNPWTSSNKSWLNT